MSVTTLQGRNVVITGRIDGYTRAEATSLLSRHGAHVQERVTKQTDVLIYGNDVGRTKIDKAAKEGVPAIPWVDALAVLQGAPVQPSAPPAAAPTRNQPAPVPAGSSQVSPMLCLATDLDEAPDSDAWFFEVKWDGYRCIAHVNGATQLASRKGLDLNRFERIREELDQLPVACILDGEIVALDEEGRSHFERLHAGETSQAKFMVFDLLAVQRPDPNPNRELLDIRTQPLKVRRELLAKVLEGGVYVTESPLFERSDRDALIEYARENELEGIVCKRADSIYKEGARNNSWLKVKFRLEQEFVVVGFTAGEGRRAGNAGAFLLAVNDGTKSKPKWVHCGEVGSGGTDAEIRAIRDSLRPLGTHARIVSEYPFAEKLPRAELKKITWVEPEVVLQVKFQRWTGDGKLWHPSIQHVRDDKWPVDVRRSA